MSRPTALSAAMIAVQGSVIVNLSRVYRDFYPPGVGAQAAYRGAGIPFQYRSKDEFARFLDGLELVEPGIVPMVEWRPELEPGPQPSPSQAGAYAALARKP